MNRLAAVMLLTACFSAVPDVEDAGSGGGQSGDAGNTGGGHAGGGGGAGGAGGATGAGGGISAQGGGSVGTGGGTTATGGSAGTGGGSTSPLPDAGTTCSEVSASYAKALHDAKACTASSTACMSLRSETLGCFCVTFVNDATQVDAITVQWHAMHCFQACPAIACRTPDSGTCTNGECVDTDEGP